ncbi:hypothetical protein RFI_24640 [Reticulomyxa filosa]|uniref:Uncharacterized protein n=1 Tax=Reticulomyxa filosa TaxID=46433 RepID=X6MI49_RETFI|nr:hypothetical protein RFI_24640 [Reticulomyxa filosa]|eukprot:ETO12735.1 hypothetical protein RFI_24640 [Reticulomyxa filosa]
MYQKPVLEVGPLLRNLHYKDLKAAESQVLQAIHQVPSLRPETCQFVANDGTSQILFKLEGTIPITYQMKTYHIPVVFWLPLDYPASAPRCFVTPVAGMKVKPRHPLVDSNGVIYHMLLTQWHYSRSSLVQLIGTLCSEFGTNPPVYSTGQQPQQQQQQQQPQPQQQPLQSQPLQSQPQQQQQLIEQQRQSGIISPSHSLQYGGGMLQQSPSLHSNPGVVMGGGPNIKEQFAIALKGHLQKVYEQENAEINQLSSRQKKLDQHSVELDAVKEKAKKEHAQLLERKTALAQRNTFLERFIENNQSSADTFDVNKVVLPSDIWSEQCMDATAQDFAITDVMLELDRALEDETVDLTAYLKQLRKLSRDQFMKRALAKKVYETQSLQVSNANKQNLHS